MLFVLVGRVEIVSYRSSRSQMFFKSGDLKNSAIFMK